ncbi:MAG: nuclear transport factor 2 family protein [Planctomycetota bacterium]
MWRRILIGAGLVFVLVVAVRQTLKLLASEESRVRAAVERVIDAFNDRDGGDVLEGLTTDFRETTLGFGRDDIRRALAVAFLRGGTPLARGDQRAAVRGDIAVRVDGEAATAEFVIAVESRSGGEWTETWRAAFVIELEKRDDRWLLHRSSHESLSGRRPF